jgi:hypothetical protein
MLEIRTENSRKINVNNELVVRAWQLNKHAFVIMV